MKKKLVSQPAFFGLRVLVAFTLFSGGVLLALAASGAFSASEQDIIHIVQGTQVFPVVFEGDVRNLPQVPQNELVRPETKEEYDYKQLLFQVHVAEKSDPNIPLAPMPGPIQNFPGLSFDSSVSGGPAGSGLPPDTNGDVGPNHYIQAVNSAFAIYDKTGALRASFTENSLWAGTGAPQCDGHAQGDPVVIYDPIADRWILTNLAFPVDDSGRPVSPFYECLAVSRTSDPVSGGWNRYALRMDTGVSQQPPVNTFNDYPKFGVWTDCLYYTANGLDSSGNFAGGEFATFSRSDMYAGLPLTWGLGYVADTNDSHDFFTVIPSNISGPAGSLPPAGTPNYHVQWSGDGSFSFRVRKATAGPNCGGGGTVGPATRVLVTSFVPLTVGNVIVPQPPPATASNNLDSLGHQLMQKVQYRKVGNAESLWATHTFSISPSGPIGSQWAQLDVTGGTIATTPLQQQKYDPADGIYRWMSSIAADKDGNVALGYSTSSASSFPSIAYSGRLANDTPNMLPQSETQFVAGNGSQINNCGNPSAPCHRWGDYSAMSVDPDGCTFWYTNQYYASQANGSNGTWNTRIASFKFSSCGVNGTPSPTPTATPLVVTNTNSSGPGSLADVIANANANPAAKTISFGLPGSGPWTITTSTTFEITAPVMIDGTSQPGYDGQFNRVYVEGTVGVFVPNVFDLRSHDGTFLIGTEPVAADIKGLGIYNFDNAGVLIDNANRNWIEDCYIGFKQSGGILLNTTRSSHSTGIEMRGSNNQVHRSTISGVENGLVIGEPTTQVTGLVSTDNLFEGNRIGADPTGQTTQGYGNTSNGILLGAGVKSSWIGAWASDGYNVIAGNGSSGVEIGHPTDDHNRIFYNYFGVNNGGTRLITGNTNQQAILIDNGAQYNAAWSNVIAGNRDAAIIVASSNNWILGNIIGLNQAQTQALGGQPYGILLKIDTLNTPGVAPQGNAIGGSDPDPPYYSFGNVICNQALNGIEIENGVSNGVMCNWIGFSTAGQPFPNAGWGAYLLNSSGNSSFGCLNAWGPNGLGRVGTSGGGGNSIQ
jgi:hypothetical protein